MTDTYSGTQTRTLTDDRGPADLTSQYSAHNYHPLPVMAATAEGVWVTDVAGRRYLDMLAGYSALNFGHRHPRLVAAAMRQLERVTLVSRAFDHDQFGPFCAELAELCGMEMVLPMNTGAEAVETAIKVARKWGYVTRGVPADQAIIVVFDGNFHGRTTTIVSFSSDPDARDDFGPYTPGFVSVPYGDLSALTDAFGRYGSRVVGVLVEPIQGEAGRGRAAARVPGRGAVAVHVGGRADDRGRDPVRARPGRHHLRVRGRRRGAGRLPARQGAGRRDRAGLGDGLLPLGARRAQAGAARVHVRRQPARVRGRARGHRDAAAPASTSSGRPPSGRCCTRGSGRCRRRR